ncbi:hypothetical protein [Thalassobacillus devorans]|uniref:hypothetical protein n=1 Tax=Thalassobacillus devorans TaxID=279813 RepID=UPI001594A193|nr:hypothetical protein [Thalassobacillus devorans]
MFRKKTRGRKSGPLSDLFLSTLLTEFQIGALTPEPFSHQMGIVSYMLDFSH